MKGNDAKRHATGLPAALAPWIQSNKMQTGQSRIFWELSLQQQENIHISCISQEFQVQETKSLNPSSARASSARACGASEARPRVPSKIPQSQEISNRTHWTDNYTWVSNSSYLGAHSIFAGHKCSHLSHLVASLPFFSQVKRGYTPQRSICGLRRQTLEVAW